MAKTNAMRKRSRSPMRWAVLICVLTLLISGGISFLSDVLLSRGGTVVAFITLLAIVLVGILFDMIGVAVTTAQESPFHSMASRKVPGAREAIWLLRNAERVGSICNDVVGDVCGVVSGSASALIAAKIVLSEEPSFVPLLLSSTVAALTVGGKALGKSAALRSCTPIVYAVGRFLYAMHHIPQRLQNRNKK